MEELDLTQVAESFGGYIVEAPKRKYQTKEISRRKKTRFGGAAKFASL